VKAEKKTTEPNSKVSPYKLYLFATEDRKFGILKSDVEAVTWMHEL
jgi:hypothetical protein